MRTDASKFTNTIGLRSMVKSFYQANEFDPWLEQDKTFIRAVQTMDASILLSDYHDGLFSLAPVLAGWESARSQGRMH